MLRPGRSPVSECFWDLEGPSLTLGRISSSWLIRIGSAKPPTNRLSTVSVVCRDNRTHSYLWYQFVLAPSSLMVHLVSAVAALNRDPFTRTVLPSASSV